MKLKIITFLFSIALLMALIYYSDFFKVVDALSKINLSYVLLGISLWPIISFLRAFRWYTILKKIDINLPYWSVFKIYFAGDFISQITPGRVGEPMKSFLLKTVEGKSIGTTISSTLLERLMDMLVMIIIISIGTFFLWTTINKIIPWLIPVLVFFPIFLVFIVIIISSERILLKTVSSFQSMLFFISFIKGRKRKIMKFFKSVNKTFLMYRDIKLFFKIFLITMSLWIFEGFILLLAFKSLGISVSLFSTILVVAVAALVAFITILPLGLGSIELVIVLFFTSFYPLTAAEVLAAAIVVRFMSYWVYIFMGAIFFNTLKHKHKLH